MRFLSLVIFSLMFNLLSGQGGFISKYIIQDSKVNVSKAIYETSAGNYITGGFVYDTLNGKSFNRLTITGLDSDGNLQWYKKYGRFNFEYLDNYFISRSFYKTGNALYYTGCVRDSNNKYIGVLIKFNLTGDTLWQKIYRDQTQDFIPQMLCPSVDGGFFLTGFFQDGTNNLQPCLLLKTDANGNELWRKVINKALPNTQDGKAILQDTASKKILIVGYQYIGDQISWSPYDNILILDSIGTTLSQHHYNTGNLRDLLQTKDKKILAVGYTSIYNASMGSYYSYSYVVKFDLNSPTQPIWKKTSYDQFALVNWFECIKVFSNGEIMIGGSIDSIKATDTNEITKVRFVKIDPANGNITWRKDYTYPINDKAPRTELRVTSLEETSDLGWVVAIRTSNFYSNPFLFVKYDSTGCDATEEWCRSVALSVPDHNTSGWSFNLFPNPANDFVRLSIDAPLEKSFTVKIIDIAGKELSSLKVDSHGDLNLNTSEYEAGVYFVSIFQEGKMAESKRLVIVR